MRKLSKSEAVTVNGGWTYSESCIYCGTTYSYKWYEWFSYQWAQNKAIEAARQCKLECGRRINGI